MMAIHPKLERFAGRKNIRKLSKALTALEKDLAKVQCRDFSVEVVEEADSRSFMDKFLQFQETAHFDRVMHVQAQISGRDVSVAVPMEKHWLWPYSIDIPLNVSAQGVAIYEQGFASKRWVTEPKDESLARDLKKLKLPKVKWKYKDRGYQFTVRTAFEVEPDAEDPARAVWTVHSGHFPASFFGGQLPKTSCFVEAARELEVVLANHWH
ncbi:MAG: hypothetical protein MJE66_11110 [Proteobacteria bacterium]|nr:hypothetical protein [Pseudomonadota bacterium]